MDEIEIKNYGDLTICLNGDLQKTYSNLNDVLADAKPERKDVVIIIPGTDTVDPVVRHPPAWMSTWGRAVYECKWHGYSVWRGIDIVSQTAWFATDTDILIAPEIQLPND